MVQGTGEMRAQRGDFVNGLRVTECVSDLQENVNGRKSRGLQLLLQTSSKPRQNFESSKFFFRFFFF